MIDLSPALLSVPPATVTSVAVPDGTGISATDFMQTLGAFLDAQDATPEDPAALPAATGRQALAEDGKDLPGDLPGDLPDAALRDDQTPAPILAPAWFPAPMALPITIEDADTPPSSPALAAAPSVAPPTSRPEAANGPTPRPPARPGAPAPDTRLASSTAASPVDRPAPAGAQPAIAPIVAAFPTQTFHRASQIAQQPAAAAPARASQDPAPVASARDDAATQAIAVSTIAQPAGQVFAAALAAATSWHDRPTRDAERERLNFADPIAATAPIELSECAIVKPSGDVQWTALDLTRDAGLQGVIDRIETLRDTASDAADSRDTRVRLIPDALGSIDVAVRQEGDRIHVRFTAEHDATRALLAEAQPRLTELAAARGVRIGDTSVSTQTGGGGEAMPQYRTALPAPPVRARAPISVARETDTLADHRLA